jgi:hypothetical protein
MAKTFDMVRKSVARRHGNPVTFKAEKSIVPGKHAKFPAWKAAKKTGVELRVAGQVMRPGGIFRHSITHGKFGTHWALRNRLEKQRSKAYRLSVKYLVHNYTGDPLKAKFQKWDRAYQEISEKIKALRGY